MIITEFDKPLTAEEARKISRNNNEDSIDRSRFRNLMGNIREYASFGYTRYQSMPANKDLTPSDHVCNVLRSMGYKVTIKRAYLWDDEKKDWSDKPWLDWNKREQFITEVTWG